jgi:lysophospholipase L1-like esterase
MRQFVKKVLAYLLLRLHPEPKNPTIMLMGDSLIRMGNWKKLLNRSDVSNQGRGGDTLSQIYERLKQLGHTTATILFIGGGTNDLPPSNAESLFADYQEIIKFIRAKPLIPVVISLVYISPQAAKKYPWRADWRAINSQIASLNEKLKAFCAREKIDFIDLNSCLSDPVQLKATYTTDGVHFTESAYRIWANEMMRILQKHRI